MRVTAGALALAGTALTGHLVYPVLTWAVARRRPVPVPPIAGPAPGLSVVVPAYREAGSIAGKVADALANGYPGSLEVIVVAEDEATACAAAGTGAVVLGGVARRGKAAALNRGVAAATHELVAFTDADAHLHPGALEALVRWFADPAVGAVAGENRPTGPTGEAVYWRFEAWLKRQEFRLGSTIAVSGGLFAVRRDGWRPVPEGLIADDFWVALDVAQSGRRVAYEPAAGWLDDADDPNPGLGSEWRRRTRIVAGTLDLVWRRRRLLVPGSGVAAQLWGHRVVRSSLGPVAHAVLLARALRRARHRPLARAFVGLHAVGAAALWRRARGARLVRAEHVLAQLLLLQGVGLAGTCRYLRGDRAGMYEKAAR